MQLATVYANDLQCRTRVSDRNTDPIVNTYKMAVIEAPVLGAAGQGRLG